MSYSDLTPHVYAWFFLACRQRAASSSPHFEEYNVSGVSSKQEAWQVRNYIVLFLSETIHFYIVHDVCYSSLFMIQINSNRWNQVLFELFASEFFNSLCNNNFFSPLFKDFRVSMIFVVFQKGHIKLIEIKINCSFQLYIHQRIQKKCNMVFTSIIFLEQQISILEGFLKDHATRSNDAENSALHHRNIC